MGEFVAQRGVDVHPQHPGQHPQDHHGGGAEVPKGGADAKRSVQQDQMEGGHQPNDRSGSVSGPGLAGPFDEGRHAAKTAVRFMVGSAPRSHNHGNGHESLLPHK